MIVIIGSFDGFHLGHQRLFEEAEKMAASMDDEWGVLTFYPNPRFFFPVKDKRCLFDREERKRIVDFLQIPKFFELPFNPEVAKMAPDNFISLLRELYGISGIVVGNNFRFGKNRTGNIEYLEFLSNKYGWPFKAVEIYEKGGTPVSSTMIRGQISCGNLKPARELLGYPFFIRGEVVSGDKRGRSLGYPTANIEKPADKVLPPDGVYACGAVLEGKLYPAAVNIGFNPTFFDVFSIRIEAYLLDFSSDIYERDLSILFFDKIRGEIAFPNVSDLISQMDSDIRETREIFRENMENRVTRERLERLTISLS